MGVGVLTTGWFENVEANLANDGWVLWLGAGTLFLLLWLFVAAVVEAFRDDDEW